MLKKIMIVGMCLLVFFLHGCQKKVKHNPVDGLQFNIKEELSTQEHRRRLQATRDAVAEEFEDYMIPSIFYNESMITQIFDLSKDSYNSIIAQGPATDIHVDTFIGIHPKKGYEEYVKLTLETYKEYLVNESQQYPVNMTKVKAAQIIEDRDYIFFIMLGGYEVQSENDAIRLQELLKENKRAIKVIKGMAYSN